MVKNGIVQKQGEIVILNNKHIVNAYETDGEKINKSISKQGCKFIA